MQAGIQVYFEYKGNANESMELSQLTFDAVRGRVDTEEGVVEVS